MSKRKIAASAFVKLHNKRVAVVQFDDGGFGLHFRRLDEDNKPKITNINLSNEAMDAVVRCYISIVQDNNSHKGAQP